MELPAKYADLFSRDKRVFATLALVKKDGTPQVTPIWFDWDGTHVVINTARGRIKDKILHRLRNKSNNPIVAIVMVDPADPYRYVQVRGKVVEETEEGAYEMICSLNQKYHGTPDYPKRPGEVRVTYKILPEHFSK